MGHTISSSSDNSAFDLLEMLYETPHVRACDYLRSWELVYDTDPDFLKVRAVVYALIPPATMSRITLGNETSHDMLLASAFVMRNRPEHVSLLRSKLGWVRWVCVRADFKMCDFIF